jgi:hypothetical protein
VGRIERTPTGWLLRRPTSAVAVQVLGDLRPESLEGVQLRWVFKGWVGVEVAGVEPMDCAAVREIRLRQQARVQVGHGAGYSALYGPKPVGTSPLERIAKPMDQLREIRRLAERKDDPAAWSALANGYRILAVRAPLEAAMKAVGWEHFAHLVASCTGQWPDGLKEWVEVRRLEEHQRDRTKSAHTYRHGDYGVADF